MTCANAMDFRLSQGHCEGQAASGDSDVGLALSDSASVVFGEDCRIGRQELYTALLAMPSVDPKLVSRAWLNNHFRWIVWKLANFERKFPQIFAGK